MSWPFERWQQIAIRRFGLAPTEFWALPVREWLSLLDGAKPSGFDRTALADLLDIYPDTGDENEPE